MRPLGLFAALVAVILAAPAPADAKTYTRYHQVNASLASTVGDLIGFVPIKNITPLDKVVTFKVGRDRWRGTWNNNLYGGSLSTTFLLKVERREARQQGLVDGLVFADRALTAAESKHFVVLADLGRHADVLSVARDHPACRGLTLAQARQIASGAVTRWSQVISLPPGQPDEIALRHRVVNRAAELRFGVLKPPATSKGAADGGVGAASAGDRSIAAISSWARARGSGACAVPLDGVAPSNASVHSLTYPGAHPISLVGLRLRQHPYKRAIRKAYVAFIKSARAGALFKRNGMMLAGEPPPADAPSGNGPSGSTPGSSPAPSGGPTQDAQGRPITSTRDDDGVRAAIGGERLQQAGDSFTNRFAFEGDGVLRRLNQAPDGSSCTQVTGTWKLEAGWRYHENGGGMIARVQLQFDTLRTVTIELSNESPTVGYMDGIAYTRSRELPGSCP